MQKGAQAPPIVRHAQIAADALTVVREVVVVFALAEVRMKNDITVRQNLLNAIQEMITMFMLKKIKCKSVRWNRHPVLTMIILHHNDQQEQPNPKKIAGYLVYGDSRGIVFSFLQGKEKRTIRSLMKRIFSLFPGHAAEEPQLIQLLDNAYRQAKYGAGFVVSD